VRKKVSSHSAEAVRPRLSVTVQVAVVLRSLPNDKVTEKVVVAVVGELAFASPPFQA
jgi:hypothetical protein